LERLLDNMLQQSTPKSQQEQRQREQQKSPTFMTLHARVEPDMQRHMVCKDKKVLLLRDIIQMVESKFLTPPNNISVVFLPINRQYLEQEGTTNTTSTDEIDNPIAVDNLKVLNQLRDHGMWNGTVPVLEFGANALKGTVYEHRPSTAGAILNYFLGLQPQCSVFVGTEVSSFSHDVLAARFFRYGPSSGNYKYLPNIGLQEWMTPDMADPPGHVC